MLNLKFAAWLFGCSCFVGLPTAVIAKQPAPTPVKLVKIYKYQGSVQCQGGGEPLAKMRRQLIKRGVSVVKGQCGVDGLMYPSVCGAPDGRINIFTIQAKGLSKAQAQGFDLLKTLADAQLTACKL